jgi:hypothetical protein
MKFLTRVLRMVLEGCRKDGVERKECGGGRLRDWRVQNDVDGREKSQC